jgi:hypothetical protein
LTKQVLVEVIKNRTASLKEVHVVENTEQNWMTPIKAYLTSGTLPKSPLEADHLVLQSQ